MDQSSVSVILHFSNRLPYGREDMEAILRSLAKQSIQPAEWIFTREEPEISFDSSTFPNDSICWVDGPFANRSVRLNAALEKCTGGFVLMILNDSAPVILRHSALDLLLSGLRRHARASFAFGDHEIEEPSGERKAVRLLPPHPGRVRDSYDPGRVLLFRTSVLKEIGGLEESFSHAGLYDLRLKASEKGQPVHIGNRRSGALYSIRTAGGKHNVFDYLMAGKEVQLEMEQACTEHLKRTGAWLPPGKHIREVAEAGSENKDCLVSVVIPVHRRPEFIGDAIRSAQNQTVQTLEVIVVVNGGPDDPTLPEAKRYEAGGDLHDSSLPPVRVACIDINNIGLSLNTGCRMARGRYYFQLDSDDQLMPEAVEKVLAVFKQDRHVGMVIGSYEVWEKDESSGELFRRDDIPVVTHDEWTEDNGRNNLLRINGAGAPRVIDLTVWREMGGFGVNDTPYSLNYGEDYELVLRISESYRIGRVWEPIYKVVRHSGGTDHSIDQATIDRNDEAKDRMRLEAIQRRQSLNLSGKD